ncbi:class Ib ribonucleoside-diphosphate reductase assembly flavoprotein NrdI [Arthrobacter sp. B0490]|uniref:class Ib ribonucleoside-diphosphate reductase assembly flavoprotein NrdI n=1 Tax=Arthrobacter sp. B0490 TaxID=2058891 RepID=UPI000CE307EE|nr:class Ib ribonucleoside-diphosphate reductase assembly flavoprotein NrdI [Arthrobacter sp. B0490]
MSALAVDDQATSVPPVGETEGPVTGAPLIYFSSVSDNTHRFVKKLGIRAARMPVLTKEPTLRATRPYVLVLPTYGGITGKGAVPRQVVKFLNNEQNRDLLRGVIGAGNTNFGETYCLAADIVAAKCDVPVLYRFEVMGTSEDVDRVTKGLEEFWT